MYYQYTVQDPKLFTLPIALSGIIQQLFNAADTSIVGYFDNAAALAAVGTNGEIVALIVTLSAGCEHTCRRVHRAGRTPSPEALSP